jgi:signal recognition particle subunit SRP54
MPMLENLSDKLGGVFRSLSGRGRISEENIREAMREVRTALLEADVNFKVVKDFTEASSRRPSGRRSSKACSPAS